MTVQSEAKIDLAKTKGVTEEIITDELKALSGTVFNLKGIKFNWMTKDPAFISNKEVKQLRQKATEQLVQLRSHTRVDGWETPLDFEYQLKSVVSQTPAEIQKTKLVVLLREKSQVDTLVNAIINKQVSIQSLDAVILDFEFGRDYVDSIKLLKTNKIKVGIATTRILKPNEYQNLKNIKNMDPDFVLARNLGAVHYFKNINPLDKEIRGDFSLNITNHFSANYLLNKGLSTACVSYDLNADQLNLLLENSHAQKLEVTVHQAMPSFHMEHCVFAAFLSRGTSFKDCGKPCEKHKVQLKDQFGNYHWLKPDHECRNTMYNAKSQTALPYLSQWQKHHIGFIRYEALYEQGAELIQKISAYLKVLDGQQTSEQASLILETVESYGLSSGSLAKSQEYQSRKKSIDGAKL
jgi:putative protease